MQEHKCGGKGFDESFFLNPLLGRERHESIISNKLKLEPGLIKRTKE